MLFRSVRSGSSGTNCFSKWKLTLGEARELPWRGGGVGGGAGKGCRKSDLTNTLFKRFIRWTGYTLRIRYLDIGYSSSYFFPSTSKNSRKNQLRIH